MPSRFGGGNFAVLNLQSPEIPKRSLDSNWQRVGLGVNTNKDIQERTNLGFDAITKLQQFAGGLNEPKPFPKELLGDSKHLCSDACSVFQINSILGSIHLTSTEIT